MEFIFELVFTILFEGAIEVMASKKVPLPVRILVGVLFFGFYFGLAIALLIIGIINKNGLIIAIAIFLIIMFAWATVYNVKKRKGK